MSKSLLESTTIQAAIASYGVLVISSIFNVWTPGREVRPPTQTDILALVAGGYTLAQTIQGRKRATEKIGGVDPTPVELEYEPRPLSVLVEESGLIPDFSYIENLPSAEYSTDISVIHQEDSVDNDEEDISINLASLQGQYSLVAKQDTRLKTSTEQSVSLKGSDFVEIKKGQKIKVDYWKFPQEKNSHIEVGIDEHKNINEGTFYVYTPHFNLFNVQGKQVEIEVPTSEVPVIKKGLTRIALPGNTSDFYLENPIYPGSHFTWAEATKNGERVPQTRQIVDNIVKQARELDKLRAWLGNRSLVVTSWYRDPRTNAAVGGASGSSHLNGSATDILCPGMNILTFQSKVLESWKVGGVGKGASKGFVHVASDGFYRVWNY